MKTIRGWLYAIALVGASLVPSGVAAVDLPAGLSSPDHGGVCHREHGVCFDRDGPSIGLTEAFLGARLVERLTAALREAPWSAGPGIPFSPVEGVECFGETGPCGVGGGVHEGLTAVLYGPRPARDRSAEAAVVVGLDWQWLGTRYNNDTEARSADPARYLLRLEPDGSLAIQADCNRAGGQYRIEESRITIEVTHSTMAACEPGSLERVFLRDLSAASVYFLRRGRLFLDLRYDTGTMEFGR